MMLLSKSQLHIHTRSVISFTLHTHMTIENISHHKKLIAFSRWNILSGSITLIHLALALHSTQCFVFLKLFPCFFSLSISFLVLFRFPSEYKNPVHSHFSSISMDALFCSLCKFVSNSHCPISHSLYLKLVTVVVLRNVSCCNCNIRECYRNVIDYEMVNFMACFTHTVHQLGNRSTVSSV